MAAKKKPTFESQLAAVENLIAEMENGGLSLEESLKRYEEGMKAIADLEKELQSAQQRLTVLRQGPEGDVEVPLEEDVQ
ncbi:MAG: exodeoxyribonuclease VII small subunit [Clostridiales bacterium]|nr:exodeoxyribonuclease VII small subunit [Clostridiales bacterium]